MESVRIDNSTINFCIETASSCETDIGAEIIRDTKIKSLCLVTEIILGEGDSIVAVVQKYCEQYKDYPIVMVATSNGENKRDALVAKMRNKLVYTSLEFHELSSVYDDGDTQYYVATNKASIPLYETLEVMQFIIQFREIMADSKQTDRLISMLTGEVFNGTMTGNIKRWVELWQFDDDDDDDTIRRIGSFSDTN